MVTVPLKKNILTKPVKGQFDKAGVAPVKYLREVRVANAADYTVGQTLAADIFAEGELVDVVGTGKGGRVLLAQLNAITLPWS